MTNEEEQITLNIDLYDNIMTEKEGGHRPPSYHRHSVQQTDSRPYRESRYGVQTRKASVYPRSCHKAKVEAIAEGKSVIDGVGQYLVTARGSFIGENAQFDPVKHSLGVSYTLRSFCAAS